MSSLLEAALEYQKKGYSVVPLQPRGKMPSVKWEEFTTRKATEAEIRSWWGKQPDANIGLIMGSVSGKIAVDIDVYRGGDAKEVFDIAPTELISKTGRGGYHLIYDYDGSIPKNVVGKNGVDVRSNGGLIVAPPSIHDNGNAYEWIKTGKTHRTNQRLVAYVNKPQTTGDEPTRNTDNWLSDALHGIDHGSRNDTCAKLAGYYASKGIPRDVAIVMLETWDMNNNPPLGPEEVSVTVTSAYKTAYRHTPPVAKAKGSTSNDFEVVSMQDYMSVYGSGAVKWIIPDWLPEDTIAFIASPPGTFKTWMLLDLAVSVASGTPFLTQYPVINKGPVIVIQQEDHHGGVAERIGQVVNSKFNLIVPTKEDVFFVNMPPTMPIYFHTERKLKFNNKEIMDNLEKLVDKIRPRLVIIDPLYSAAETDDYMAKSAGEMFRLKEMRDKYHCTFVIAHHKKKRSDGNDREGLWGSQFLNAFLETGWQVRSVGDTSVSVRRHFKVKKESNELVLNFDINTERYPYTYKITSQESTGEADTDVLKLLDDGEALDPEEISKILGISKTSATKKLRFLEKDKMVVKVGTKYKSVITITEF